MTTHQAAIGASDDEFVRTMVESYAGRFNDAFWAAFDREVRPRLGDAARVADIGCGPGLLLQDLSRRLPGASLHGFDVTPAMIEYATGLHYAGDAPALRVADVSAGPLPVDDSSFDLVAMGALLHLFDDPFPELAEVQRVLAPGGTLLLYDWVRNPLRTYVETGPVGQGEATAEGRRTRSMRLFAAHNRYTGEDWHWVLAEAGFSVLHESTPASGLHRLFICAASG